MASLKPLEKAMVALLTPPLARAGFRHSGHQFYRRIPMGRQILYLTFAYPNRSYMSLAAWLAISHTELDRLHNVLLGRRPNDPMETWWSGWGNLGDGVTSTWTLTRMEEVAPAARSFLAIFWKAHRRYFDQFTSLEDIFRYASQETRAGEAGLLSEVVLLAAFLLGKQDQLDRLAESQLEYMRRKGYPYIDSFRQFVERLRRYAKDPTDIPPPEKRGWRKVKRRPPSRLAKL